MATFLEICQDVARESGTIPTIGDPSTVLSQSGRLARIVYWVRDAYKIIQNDSENWRWLTAEFSGSLTASTQAYAATSLGISSRFDRWVTRGPNGENLFSIYLTSDGQSTEGLLRLLDFHEFRMVTGTGAAATQTGKPVYMAIDDANNLTFWPIPDATYTVRGRYRKSAQILAADADTPEMPSQFHDAIKWRALMLMAVFDESMSQYPAFASEFGTQMDRLRRSQLPTPTVCGALA